MATVFQPPPTYTEVVVYEKNSKDPEEFLRSARFNPIWLKWFLDLVKGIGSGGSGSGTVVSVSISTANNQGTTLSGSITNPTTTPVVNITIGLGAITPTSVAATGAVSAGTSVTAGTALIATTKLYPSTPAGATQTATSLYGGTGAPSNTDGSDGDYYFRSNGAAGTFLYKKAAGTWTGIL